MSLFLRSLRGTDAVVSANRAARRSVIIGDEIGLKPKKPKQRPSGGDRNPWGYKHGEYVFGDDDYGGQFYQAVDELLGFDISSAIPYVSAFTSGFGGGNKDQAAIEAAKKQAEMEARQREAEQKAASARTTMWVVLGILGAGIAGTGLVLATRRK